MSVRQSENAFVAEVARYLLVDPADVKRMIDLDGLPAISIPKVRRPVLRIPLRGLHGWLMKRAKNYEPRLMNYEMFKNDFLASRIDAEAGVE